MKMKLSDSPMVVRETEIPKRKSVIPSQTSLLKKASDPQTVVRAGEMRTAAPPPTSRKRRVNDIIK